MDAAVVGELQDAFEVARLRMLHCLLLGVLKSTAAAAWAHWRRGARSATATHARQAAALRAALVRKAAMARRGALRRWFHRAQGLEVRDDFFDTTTDRRSNRDKYSNNNNNDDSGGSNNNHNHCAAALLPACSVTRRRAALRDLQVRALGLVVSAVRRQLSCALRTWAAAALLEGLRAALNERVARVRRARQGSEARCAALLELAKGWRRWAAHAAAAGRAEDLGRLRVAHGAVSSTGKSL